MPNSNNGQIVLGLDIPKTVNQINADIKKLEKQLEQVKATGVLDTDKTVKQLNAQIKSLQTQLKTIEIKATVDQKSIQKTGQQIGSQIKNATKGSSVASEILNASDLDKQGKTYILKVSNTIEATKKEIQSKLKNSGYFDIEIKGVEKANGQIKSIIVNATNAKGVLEQLNFERAKMQKGGKVTNALVQTDDVKVLGTISSSIDKVQGNLSTLKSKWEEQGVLVGDFKTKVEQLENSIVSVGSKGELSGLESQIKALKTEASQIAEVNKIQHSLDVGDYDAQIETIKKGFIGLSGDANEAETHVKGLRTALKAMHDATDDNSRLTAEKNYRLELEKTHNQLTIAKAKAKEYVDVLKVQKLRNDIQDWLRKNTAATQEAKNAMTAYLNTLDDVGHVSQSSFNEAKQALDNWDTQMRQAGKLGKSLTETFKDGVKSFTSWAISSGAVMEVWNGLKNGLKTIKDLDTALVDLRKTTDATAQELEDFYFSSNETAKQLGVTTSEVINATSAWSRLGYAIEDATTLAKNSAILASISPEMDIDTATDGLVSTLKAFKIEAEDSLDGVISKINIIGNTQAVDNNDVVDILTRSSSAMAEANNTLEETIALGVAATEITRDADAVGNMLKTVSMRIRGRQTLPPYTVMYMLCA